MAEAQAVAIDRTAILGKVALLLVTFLLGDCQSKPQTVERRTDMNPNLPGHDLCIGRFRFRIPDELVVESRTQSIYRVDVQTVSLGREGVRGILQSKVREVEPISPLPGSVSSILTTFDIKPGIHGIWYADDPEEPQSHRLFAVRQVGDHAVTAERGASSTGHTTVGTLIGNVIDSYVPSTGVGFCVGAGAVTTEAGRNERVVVTFSHAQNPDVKVEFMTETVREPDTSTYSDITEEQTSATAAGGRVNVLRDRMRNAGGVNGNEMWISLIVPEEKPLVRFIWEFAGMPENAIQPFMQFRAYGPLGDQPRIEQIWEMLITTLRPVPAPPDEP